MPLSDATLGDALEITRTYLNDDVAALWTDAALIPKAKAAHRELQAMLWEVGSPAVRAQSDPITVTASTTDITSLLPDDLLQPFSAVEYAATVETLADAVPMTEKFYLPNQPQTGILRFWSWQKEKFLLLGASANRKIVINYRRQIPIPVENGDSLGILFAELYIGPRVAAIAHGSLGNEAAYKICTDEAGVKFNQVVKAQRGQQTPPMRP